MDKPSGCQIKEEILDDYENWDIETVRFIQYVSKKLYIRARKVQCLFKTAVQKRKARKPKIQ